MRTPRWTVLIFGPSSPRPSPRCAATWKSACSKTAASRSASFPSSEAAGTWPGPWAARCRTSRAWSPEGTWHGIRGGFCAAAGYRHGTSIICWLRNSRFSPIIGASPRRPISTCLGAGKATESEQLAVHRESFKRAMRKLRHAAARGRAAPRRDPFQQSNRVPNADQVEDASSIAARGS